MNLITEAIEEIQRQDRVEDIDLSGVVEILHQANEAYNRALTIHVVSKSLPSDIEIGKAMSELSDIADKEVER